MRAKIITGGGRTRPTIARRKAHGKCRIHAWQQFGAKFTTDVDVSYTFLRIFTLTLGANNLFNTYPDKIAQWPINPVFPMSGAHSRRGLSA